MKSLVKILRSAPNARPWLVVASFLIASLTEGIGIMTFVPALAVVAGAQDAVSGNSKFVLEWFATIGIEPKLPLLLGFAVLAMAIKAGITFVAMQSVSNASADVAASIRRQVIAGILRARWPYVIAQPRGRITHAISGEANRAAEAYVQATMLVAIALQTIVYLAIILYLSPGLAIAGIVLGLVVSGSLHALVRVSRRAGLQQTRRQRALLVFLNDSLNNLKPLRAMAREDDVGAILDRQVGEVRKTMRRQVLAREGLSSLHDVFVTAGFAVIMLVVYTYWSLSFATLLVGGFLLARTATNVGKMQKAYQKVMILESAYGSVKKMLGELAESAENRHPGAEPRLTRGITFEGVSLLHGDRGALHDVSLTIPPLQLSVLTGPSGAGKTSIVDLILGFHVATRGTIRIGEDRIEELDLTAWRRRVGYVPQELALLHDTILQNVTMGDAAIGREAVEGALKRAGALEFVRALPHGVDTMVGEAGALLSGGQRQRIALARALARDPMILILDEVTSALDTFTSRAIAREAAKLRGSLTVIAITHREEFVDVADQVLVMRAGRLVEVRHPLAARPA